MIIIVIKTPFSQSMTYKQGIECSLNLADAGDDVCVFLSKTFTEDLILSSNQDSVAENVRKQLKQLELYEIPIYSSCGFESTQKVKLNELVKECSKVVVF